MAELNHFRLDGGGSNDFVDALNAMVDAINKGGMDNVNVVLPLAMRVIDGKPCLYLAVPPDPFESFKLRANKPQGGPGETAPVKGIRIYTHDRSEASDDQERDIYFGYAPGGYIKDQIVRCQVINNQLEVASEGFHSLIGILKNPLKSLAVATLQVAIFGATHEIDVYGLFFEENTGEAIDALWCDNMQLWVAIAKVCKPGDGGIGGADHPPPTGCEYGYCRFVYGGGTWNLVGRNCSGGGLCPGLPSTPPPSPQNLDVYDECCTSPVAGKAPPAFGIHSRKGVILSITTGKGRRIGRHLEGKEFPTFKQPSDLEAFSRSLIESSGRPKSSNGRSASSRRRGRKAK